MAGKADKADKNRQKRRRRLGLKLAAAALLAALVALGFMALNAATLHLRRAEVFVPDLPPAFEGLRILYASDIDICGINTPERAADAILRMKALEPDLLLLGGDYASASLARLLDRSEGDQGADDRFQACARFFQQIAGFDAPLGTWAIAAPEDGDPARLAPLMQQAGIRPLFNSAERIERGGQSILLAGLCDASLSHDLHASGVRRGDCVICCAWSPECFPQLMTMEASDGGPLADLLLAGHTHGGQILLFGRSVLTLTDREQRCLSGWRRENDVPMLTTAGMGCEGTNLRLGSRAEAWLITLTAAPAGE